MQFRNTFLSTYILFAVPRRQSTATSAHEEMTETVVSCVSFVHGGFVYLFGKEA